MKEEFVRFGLARFRILTAILEILGGTGLLVGLWWRPALWLSSAGLTALMFLGVGVRLRCRDSFLETLPALVLFLVNLYIFCDSLGNGAFAVATGSLLVAVPTFRHLTKQAT